jgi:uncharacterized membrane protein
MEAILEWLDTKYVDFFIFILVIGAGFAQERFLKPFTWFKKDARYDSTLKTFVVSLIFSAIYIWLYKYEMKHATTEEQVQAVPVMKFFISFALATSFYDLILRLFKFVFKKKTGLDVDNAETDSNG